MAGTNLTMLSRVHPTEWMILGLIVLGLGLITYIVGEHAGAETVVQRATVVNTFYEGRRTGVGVGPSSSGGTATVVTSSGPSYNLLLEFTDGSREIVKTNKVTLSFVTTGLDYDFYCSYGYFSGSILRCIR